MRVREKVFLQPSKNVGKADVLKILSKVVFRMLLLWFLWKTRIGWHCDWYHFVNIFSLSKYMYNCWTEGSPKPNSFFCQSLPPQTITKNSVFKILLVKLREGSRCQIGKNSKRSLTSPPLFRKIMLQIFSDKYGCIYTEVWWPDSMKYMHIILIGIYTEV